MWDSHGEHTWFSRRDTYEKDPSWAAKKALTAEVTRVWTEFAQHSPDLLVAGRRAEWDADVERKQGEVEKAQKLLESRIEELSTLLQEKPALPLSNVTS